MPKENQKKNTKYQIKQNTIKYVHKKVSKKGPSEEYRIAFKMKI